MIVAVGIANESTSFKDNPNVTVEMDFIPRVGEYFYLSEPDRVRLKDQMRLVDGYEIIFDHYYSENAEDDLGHLGEAHYVIAVGYEYVLNKYVPFLELHHKFEIEPSEY